MQEKQGDTDPIDPTVHTIYIGGGTPSLLLPEEINDLFDSIKTRFRVDERAEITVEVNPDDISTAYLQGLRSAGVNRLSIGVQSLNDEQLRWMNRRHNAREALSAIEKALSEGFQDVSVDLIYGLPGLWETSFQEEVRRLLQLPFHHLSAYLLSIEEQTVLFQQLQSRQFTEISEEETFTQFKVLIDEALDVGFEQYEISNFARAQRYSRHNTAYWQGKKYLGLGPSAHSYNGKVRTWNVRDLQQYLHACQRNETCFEVEEPGILTRYNEYMLTSLRTKWGVDTKTVRQNFGEESHAFFISRVSKYCKSEHMVHSGDTYRLTLKGMFISDYIIEDFFLV